MRFPAWRSICAKSGACWTDLSEPPIEPAEFWREESVENRKDWRRQSVKWALGFAVIFAGVFLAFWWSGSALHFGANRMTGSIAASYFLRGEVVDATTGEPVRWADVADDPSGQPPLFSAQADQYGRFQLATLPIAHAVRISANGYKPNTLQAGNDWFTWWPRGENRSW